MTTEESSRSKNTLTREEIIAEIASLTRSATRVHVLEIANQQTVTTRRELRDELDVSRTTVQRNVDTLVAKGWLETTADGYQITPCGKLLCSRVSELATSVGTLRRLRPILGNMPVDEFDVGVKHLEDAEITVASANNPYAPVNKHVDALKTASEFRIHTAVIGRPALQEVSTLATSGNCTGEVVVTEGALSTLRANPSYAEAFERIARTDCFDIFVYHDDLPYYLGLIDERVQVGIEGENRVPKALLETESAAAREWAESKYSEVRQQAELVV